MATLRTADKITILSILCVLCVSAVSLLNEHKNH